MNKRQEMQKLQGFAESLKQYHGSTKIQNVSEYTNNELLGNLIQLFPEDTITQTLEKIYETLSMESAMLQFGKLNGQVKIGKALQSPRLPENQRIEFNKSGNTYERLQMLFSPEMYYFTLGKKAFRRKDKPYNNKVFLNAIDMVVIDPQKVPENSLKTLGIQLDPDCQNLKEIFKKMRPVKYSGEEEEKITIRINEYNGKYIVLAGQKKIYDVTHPATKGEQRKEDIQGHMSVYPDIFSIIRREEYILDYSGKTKEKYEELRRVFIASIKEIDRNKKAYSIRVQKNVQEIIEQINIASSAKIVAQKIYHLYKIAGRHSQQDKQHLEAGMRAFARRITELIGISSNTQFHLLKFNDTYEDQRLNLEMFHVQINMSIAANTQNEKENLVLLACENYFNTKKEKLQEPFLTFDKQIKKIFGDSSDIKKNLPQAMARAEVIIPLQEKSLQAYMLEHELNLEDKTIEEVAEELPGFDTNMNKLQRDDFFDQRKDIKELDDIIAELTK